MASSWKEVVIVFPLMDETEYVYSINLLIQYQLTKCKLKEAERMTVTSRLRDVRSSAQHLIIVSH